MAKHTLADAVSEFCKAHEVRSRLTSPRPRKKVERLLDAYWKATTGARKKMSGNVSIPAGQLYVLLHQAVQTLFTEDDQ